MKTLSRNCLLLLAVVTFVCVSDHFIAVLLPYLPKLANKTMGKVLKTVSEIERVVRHI